MANQIPNTWKAQLWKPFLTAFDADNVYKIILMAAGFSFDKDTHIKYADISASELPTGNGYTAGGITLTGMTRTIDDTGDMNKIIWNNVQWNASGGSLIASGAIIYLNRVAGTYFEHTDIIVSYKDAGTNITASDGTPIIISAIAETVEGKT